jgi:two-component system response regulator
MSQTGTIEVLLVEDSAEDAELAIRALRDHNLANRIHHVEDGVEALAYLRESPAAAAPRVVLLDLNLPRLGGLEVLRRLRADERTRFTPVAVLTSSREDRDLEQAYRLGVNSYIVKPLDFTQFAKVMGELGLYWVVMNDVPDEDL